MHLVCTLLIITSHDVVQPLKQAHSASHAVIISGQICGSKLQRAFTLGDGCWLPILGPKMRDFIAIRNRKRMAIFSTIQTDKLIPTAEFLAIPASAVKIASEWHWRCAILVHSVWDVPARLRLIHGWNCYQILWLQTYHYCQRVYRPKKRFGELFLWKFLLLFLMKEFAWFIWPRATISPFPFPRNELPQLPEKFMPLQSPELLFPFPDKLISISYLDRFPDMFTFCLWRSRG